MIWNSLRTWTTTLLWSFSCIILIALALSFISPGPNIEVTAAAKQALSKVPEATSRPKLALLIGVNRYKDSMWPGLGGPENDVSLMRSLLKEPGFGFKEVVHPARSNECTNTNPNSDIWMLCSEQATREAILDAIDNHLIGKARQFAEESDALPEDGATVVIHYSGHGFYIKDANGDEPDGVDETIVPHDAEGESKGQITDDELRSRLSELSKYTTNITFISDSCHSGSITRGDASRGGGNSLKNKVGVGGALSDGIDLSSDHVTVTGSLPNQLAREIYYPDTLTGEEKMHGVLTYNFVSLVRQYPGSTYREILSLLQNSLSAQGLNQTPTAEGAIDRVIFGASSLPEKVPVFPVCEREKGRLVCSRILSKAKGSGGEDLHSVSLPIGNVVGASSGSPVAVYAPGTRELSGEQGLIGTGRISKSDSFSSQAVVALKSNSYRSVPENAPFVLVSPYFSVTKKLVAVDIPGAYKGRDRSTSALEATFTSIADALEGSEYVEVLRVSGILKGFMSEVDGHSLERTRGKIWELAIVSAPYSKFRRLNGEDVEPVDPDQSVIFIVDRNGEPKYHFSVRADKRSAINEVKRALELHARVQSVKSLSNHASRLSGKLLLEYFPVQSLSVSPDNQGCEVELSSGGSEASSSFAPRLRVGDKFYFEIVNASPKELYVYMYSIAADGSITYFYPGVGAHERLPIGAVFRTYEANCGVFEVLEGSMPGPESVKIIASTTPIQAEILESPRIAKGKRGNLSPLEALLSEAATYTRDAGSFSVDDWTTVDFNYVVVR